MSVGLGAAGRIRIAGPVLFSGYRLRPDLSASARDGRWFITSDLGSVSASGRLLVRGRADDMIITGGENVVAGEVAAVVGTCPGVREAVVVGRPDLEWGQLVGSVGSVLVAYAAPRALMLLPRLPLLPSGKPDLERLRSMATQAGMQA